MEKENAKNFMLILIYVLIVIIAAGCTGMQNDDKGIVLESDAIVIEKTREVIPDILEVTKTASDYINGKHVVWVEGRFKSDDGDLFLTFIANDVKGGGQLEEGVRKADEIKSLDGDWLSFKHKLIETTDEVTHTKDFTIIFTLKYKGKNEKGLLTIPAKQPPGDSTQLEGKSGNESKSKNNKGWEVVSREDRLQGTITQLDITHDKDILKSITLKGTKRIPLPGNPVEYDFTDKIFQIVFNEELEKAGILKDKLKEGAEIVVTFAQYAIPADGKNPNRTILGAYLDEIYYIENGEYYNAQGKETDLIPSSDSEYTDKPQIEVPVDLEIERFEQQQVDEGHKPWRLDPIQSAITFVSLKISPEGIVGPFPIGEKDIEVIKQDEKVAIVKIKGEKTPISKLYLKRLVRQDKTGIWSVVGYNPIKILDQQSAVKMVTNLLGDLPEGYYCTFDHEESRNGNEYYVIHYYERVIDDIKTGEGHLATMSWFYVDKLTGNIYTLDIPINNLVPYNK